MQQIAPRPAPRSSDTPTSMPFLTRRFVVNRWIPNVAGTLNAAVPPTASKPPGVETYVSSEMPFAGGSAIARALHAQGADVQLSGRRTEVLEELARELGDRAKVLPADLSRPVEVTRLAEAAGAVDVLVANAGLGGAGALPDYTLEEVE